MLEEAPLQSNFDQAVREYYVPSTNDGDGIRPIVQMVKQVNAAPWGAGVPTWVRDATSNDSDKSWTVPTGKAWVLKVLFADIVATATVGNRVLRVDFTDGTNRIFGGPPTASIPASNRGYMLLKAGYYGAAFNTADRPGPTQSTINIAITDGIPEMVLTAGCVIRVWDTAAIDAAGDDLAVVLHYIEYDA